MSTPATDPVDAGRALFLALADEHPAPAREVLAHFQHLTRREQELTLLLVEARRPGVLDEAIGDVEALLCLGCAHARHPGETCGVGYVVAGHLRTCWCSPSSVANSYAGLAVLEPTP